MRMEWAPVVGEELIDREQIINELVRNSLKLPEGGGHLYSLLGRRRIGKTSILLEVHRRLWANRGEISGGKMVPVYINLERLERRGRDFARQYLAHVVQSFHYFLTGQEPTAEARDLKFSDLERMAEELQSQRLWNHLKLFHAPEFDDGSLAFAIVDAGHEMARELGRYGAMILDEFQYIAYLEDEQGRPLSLESMAAAFGGVLEDPDPRCIYVYSGSAVTLLHKQILSQRPLLKGMKQLLLGGLAPPDALKLAEHVLRQRGHSLSEPDQMFFVDYTQGSPFYLKALLQRLCDYLDTCPPETPLDYAAISAQLADEVYNGEIFLFWEGLFEHYQRDAGIFGQEPEVELRRQILELIGHHGALKLEEVAQHLRQTYGREVAGKELEQMLWLLRRADLIEVINQRQGPHYALVNDPFAKLWLEAQYQRSLQAQAVDSLIDQEQKKLARALQNVAQKIGCLFEYKIRHLLSLFDGRWVEGRLFGVEGEVYLPQLRRVAATTVEWPGLGRHQIDGHASYYVPAELTARLGLRPDQGTGLFVAESKYRLEPVDATEVEDFRQACATVEKCNEEWGFGLTHQWLFARSGLTGPAWEVARRERMLVSDLEQLNELFEMFHLPRAEY